MSRIPERQSLQPYVIQIRSSRGWLILLSILPITISVWLTFAHAAPGLEFITQRVLCGESCSIVVENCTNLSVVSLVVGGVEVAFTNYAIGDHQVLTTESLQRIGSFRGVARFSDGSFAFSRGTCEVMGSLSEDAVKALAIILITNICAFCFFIVQEFVRNFRARRQTFNVALVYFQESIQVVRTAIEAADYSVILPKWMEYGEVNEYKAELIRRQRMKSVYDLKRLVADWRSQLLNEADALARIRMVEESVL